MRCSSDAPWVSRLRTLRMDTLSDG
jgi:hypothetical protein